MEVENGGLEDDWLVSFWGPFSTSRVMGGRVGNFFQTGSVSDPFYRYFRIRKGLPNNWEIPFVSQPGIVVVSIFSMPK